MWTECGSMKYGKLQNVRIREREQGLLPLPRCPFPPEVSCLLISLSHLSASLTLGRNYLQLAEGASVWPRTQIKICSHHTWQRVYHAWKNQDNLLDLQAVFLWELNHLRKSHYSGIRQGLPRPVLSILKLHRDQKYPWLANRIAVLKNEGTGDIIFAVNWSFKSIGRLSGLRSRDQAGWSLGGYGP